MPRPNDVGVGVAVALMLLDGRVLLGKRKGAHGAGQWSFPGGWIDRADESIDAVARREVREETGIEIGETRRLFESSNDYPESGFRSITLFRFIVLYTESIEVQNREPDKCEEWQWFDQTDAKKLDLFGSVREALDELSSVRWWR